MDPLIQSCISKLIQQVEHNIDNEIMFSEYLNSIYFV